MANLLLEPIEYKIERTWLGTWRRYVYSATGAYFAEFTSHLRLFNCPLIHYTKGICPETGKCITAQGVLAIGRYARGLFAVGPVSFGLIAVGQLAIGLFSLGQIAIGCVAIGQLAIGGYFGFGQAATGAIAIAQLGYGHYVLAQLGIGTWVWQQESADPEAVAFFTTLSEQVRAWLRS